MASRLLDSRTILHRACRPLPIAVRRIPLQTVRRSMKLHYIFKMRATRQLIVGFPLFCEWQGGGFFLQKFLAKLC
jgi:hypothetical protein